MLLSLSDNRLYRNKVPVTGLILLLTLSALGYIPQTMSDRILWAPWRSSFVLAKKEKGCPLCKAFRAKPDSADNLIVYRGKTVFVILNKFPYNTGHAMVSPNRHVRNLEKLTEEESAEMFALTAETVRILKKVVRPHSLNIGMNLGSSSGAGIPDHMHMHIVPRWTGDTSFMMVIGQTKIVSVPLDPIFHAIKKEFDKR